MPNAVRVLDPFNEMSCQGATYVSGPTAFRETVDGVFSS